MGRYVETLKLTIFKEEKEALRSFLLENSNVLNQFGLYTESDFIENLEKELKDIQLEKQITCPGCKHQYWYHMAQCYIYCPKCRQKVKTFGYSSERTINDLVAEIIEYLKIDKQMLPYYNTEADKNADED